MVRKILDKHLRQMKVKVQAMSILQRVNFLLYGIPAMVFIVLAPFSTTPLALTPVAMVFFLVLLLIAVVQVFLLMRSKRLFKGWQNGALAVVMLTFDPVPPPDVPPYWETVRDNFVLMGNEYAWQASFNINSELGIAGLSPLLYRPLVPGYPTTMVFVPSGAPDSFIPFAMVSGQQVVGLDPSYAIWNTIPAESLPVTHSVFVIPSENAAAEQMAMVSSLSINCTQCVQDIQVIINPDYVARLALDGMTSIAFRKIPLYADVTLAEAHSVAKTTGHVMNIVDNIASGIPPNTSWDWQVMDLSVGVATQDNTAFAWQFTSVSTYSGNFLSNDWTLNTKGLIRTSTFSSPDLHNQIIALPEMFQDNYKFINQPQDTALPPVKFEWLPQTPDDYKHLLPEPGSGANNFTVVPILDPISPIGPGPDWGNLNPNSPSGPTDWLNNPLGGFELPSDGWTNPLPPIPDIPDFPEFPNLPDSSDFTQPSVNRPFVP